MVGMVSPMLAIAEPRARLRLIWRRSRRAACTAARVSGARMSKAMTTPTKECGNPRAATPASMAGDSTLARPTTATRDTSSRPKPSAVCRFVGGAACSSPAPSASGPAVSVTTGRKKSRWRTVWVETNMA
jgi:hypothetical protein